MSIDLNSIAAELLPEFEAKSAELDAKDEFVSENYASLRAKGVFAAMPPDKYGGGGARHSEMCDFV